MPATELVVCDVDSAEQTVLGLVIAADCVPGKFYRCVFNHTLHILYPH